MIAPSVRNGDVSFWSASISDTLPHRDPIPGPLEADVCIVGAGLTGLWSAYYLNKIDPGLTVVVVEKERAGFGASGRNGGWLSSSLPGSRERYASQAGGRAAVLEMQKQINDAIDEIIDVAYKEGIDADLHKGGCLRVATTPAQQSRLKEALEYERSWGWGEDDLVELGTRELLERVRVARSLGALYTPHCARAHPAKLVAGLAKAVERRGVRIYEHSPVLEITPHRAVTPFGDVRAKCVLRGTEGFTACLRGQRRTWLPMNSSMIITEPLSGDQWNELGWDNCETLSDKAHAYVYVQRTADGRIALGGRGIPYRFASRIDHGGRTDPKTIDDLTTSVRGLFPASEGAQIAHAWCGVLGVPRDWSASVAFDPGTGLGYAGGYAGYGVTMANLGGRTLADLVTGSDTSRIRLPWVGHLSRPWEPEPLRWIGVRAMYTLYRAADRAESKGNPRTSPLAKLADKLSGRPR